MSQGVVTGAGGGGGGGGPAVAQALTPATRTARERIPDGLILKCILPPSPTENSGSPRRPRQDSARPRGEPTAPGPCRRASVGIPLYRTAERRTRPRGLRQSCGRRSSGTRRPDRRGRQRPRGGSRRSLPRRFPSSRASSRGSPARRRRPDPGRARGGTDRSRERTRCARRRPCRSASGARPRGSTRPGRRRASVSRPARRRRPPERSRRGRILRFRCSTTRNRSVGARGTAERRERLLELAGEEPCAAGFENAAHSR